ncbi:uncharacterized protein SPPG_03346 [Spizellomyces punctatus DAOM BR117]|uniref:Uncharacterized protein n=1 Tax=Spizellomyces punctatus (strain DAOM BR117) TaxID=645134 RepID=A0A0L0HKX3_SPIPD|nr:uncharacterized protein SPPG_03346 [Spizellomyces punctatus DAOM BR117]KND01545.1 hypothetical protein SPPG_03346 [Spizellomyces punctatus DAOM BR117]|eukprot:XP_016609584.1 hypothetical protein SPPG_03346 [Spizellomyces punctatus DAOM BR117]
MSSANGPFSSIPVDERTMNHPLGRALIRLKTYQPTLEEQEALKTASRRVTVYSLVGAGAGGFLGNYLGRRRNWNFRPRIACAAAVAIVGFYTGGFLGLRSAAKYLYTLPNSPMMDIVRHEIKKEEFRRMGATLPEEIPDSAQERSTYSVNVSGDSSWGQEAPSSPFSAQPQPDFQTSNPVDASFPRSREDWEDVGKRRTNQYGDVIE